MLLILLSLVLASSGCLADNRSTATTGTVPGTTEDSTSPSSSAPEASGTTLVSSACAGDQPPFTEFGAMGSGGSARSEAAVVDALGWDVLDGCDRFRLTFSTPEGAPAVSPPTVGAEFLRHAGVIRIQLASSVMETAVFEQLIDSDLMRRAYAYSTAAGTLIVDLHLAKPAFARVVTETGPAAVVVELIPGGDPYAAPADTGDRIVVIGPDPEVVGYPITVTGYADPELRQISARLEAGDGSVIAAEAAIAEAAGPWGGFALVFPDGPSGDVTITVEGGPVLELAVP